MKILNLILIISFLVISCKKDKVQDPIDSSIQLSSFSSDIVIGYINIELELIKSTPGYVPPVSGRAIGFTWLAYYEATVNGMNKYKSLQLTQLLR